ncbi:fumarylacetoacetate hydrolase family protein [Tepidimonas taiwanensis]|uniref:Ureidoglycolate lyase n=1 Tax=Tepidimonas taiwanensis TaxID=307486 RepID=A0A554X8H9_9BURK|nr:fumarylacetoacetate hydrolase family protein [Tepidimonas taiwanensis]MCX7692364.1 fumarylacetoacetate hydrolase family protein [Tepidimonas taiwanensis]MDM7463243.1 fumarylacetoacetate hydrolase family protein [Tepidimonas taiwanensis]TSE32130.1 Ureidoglycolate lyase [Tepidimonas taiwanensis]UBQ06072.1 fumarylacetoacetate hydrolase family protein [Tepidimonas taiwanensis]
MKLFRHGAPGSERPGLLDAHGVRRDLTGIIVDVVPGTIGPDALRRLARLDASRLPEVDPAERLGPCIGEVGNVIAIGLNYADHAAEAGLPLPKQPIVFSKHTAAISGPDDDVWLPPGAAKLDWEVELAVVIGQPAWHVPRERALDVVAGYCLANDVSERAHQLEMDGQWIKGKSYPTHCPLGPWLVTADEVPDPQAVELWLDVNGTPRQRGSTRTMVFGVAEIVSYLSRFMRLLPGDVILTGTPPGVGMGQRPPQFLRAGDVVTLGSPQLGQQRQCVVDAPLPAR